MAIAERKIVEIPVTTVKQEERIILTLTREEAQTLRDVFACIGGHPKTTRRGIIDGVNAAIHSAGVMRTANEDSLSYYSGRDMKGSISFC